jgi:hypothetical protein
MRIGFGGVPGAKLRSSHEPIGQIPAVPRFQDVFDKTFGVDVRRRYKGKFDCFHGAFRLSRISRPVLAD